MRCLPQAHPDAKDVPDAALSADADQCPASRDAVAYPAEVGPAHQQELRRVPRQADGTERTDGQAPVELHGRSARQLPERQPEASPELPVVQ